MSPQFFAGKCAPGLMCYKVKNDNDTELEEFNREGVCKGTEQDIVSSSFNFQIIQNLV